MNKSVASLALIKANWDYQRKDYIENFVPFILSLISKKKYVVIDVTTICDDFRSEFGLAIPYHPMISIIQRVAKRGYIERRRYDRKYHPIYSKIDDADFTEKANEQEQKYLKVLTDFCSFCRLEYNETVEKENAENILISFLKEHDIDILFLNTKKENLLPEIEKSSNKERFLFNSYIKKLNETGSDYLGFLVDISIGHIISNTLLCENYESYQESLRKCNLYLDIQFLFNLFGINGTERREVHQECIKLMLSNKAKLYIFKHTYSEFKTIIEGCLTWISNRSYDISKANRALIFFLENGYSASDIEEFIISIEDELISLGIEISDAPGPKENVLYQIDEERLQAVIEEVYKDREVQEHTILIDIKSINSIYKLRMGREAKTIREATHILVTMNSSLAYASLFFDKEQRSKDYGFAIPTVLTDVFMGTIMWINRPNAAIVNKKRLIANCYAALLPSKLLIKKMLDAIDRLRARGEINDEQVILLKESRTARNLLSKETMGDPERFTDRTPIEILEEIKAEVRKEEQDKYEKEKKAVRDELAIERAIREFEIIKEQLGQLDNIKEKLDNKAKWNIQLKLWIGIGLYIILWSIYGISRFFPAYEILDKFVYFLGGWTIIQYVYFVITKKHIAPKVIYESYVDKQKRKTYIATGFSLEKYLSLKKESDKLIEYIGRV